MEIQMKYEHITDKIIEKIVMFGPKVLAAIVILIVGYWIIKLLTHGLKRTLEKSNVDQSLRPFLVGMINISLKIMLLISVLSMLGVQMTSFIALLGAAGLAVGMALSGTLQNFAGGVMILVLRPFKVGDVIDAQGYLGSVAEIQIFNTILKTPDNKTIIIPNRGLSTSSMINLSTEETRRVDWTVGIAYGDDLDKAKAVLGEMCECDDRILKDPEVFIAVSELADSSVNLVVRAWVKSDDYWGVFFDMNENIYKTFASKGLNIPFPQMDVHLHK